jgi:hypothetical protein
LTVIQQRCAVCGHSDFVRANEEIDFSQWTDRGRVFCRVRVPLCRCNSCGAKEWDEETEAIIEEAVRREYDKKS